jgi:hypothetical protein
VNLPSNGFIYRPPRSLLVNFRVANIAPGLQSPYCYRRLKAQPRNEFPEITISNRSLVAPLRKSETKRRVVTGGLIPSDQGQGYLLVLPGTVQQVPLSHRETRLRGPVSQVGLARTLSFLLLIGQCYEKQLAELAQTLAEKSLKGPSIRVQK